MTKQQLEAVLTGARSATVSYRERHMITRFSCIDIPRNITLYRPWIISGLLYGYLDRFNTRVIAIEDILQVEV